MSLLLLKLKGLICKYEQNYLLHRLLVLLNGQRSNFLQDYYRYNTNTNGTVFVSDSLAHPWPHVIIHSDPHGDALSSLQVGREKMGAIKILCASSAALVCP